MTENYMSVFAPQITGLIAAKRALGYSYKTVAFHLKSFDQYCVASSPSSTLSRELVLGWAKAKDGEAASSRGPRLSAVRELGKYMQALGIRHAFVLPTGLQRKIERYVPHFFTAEEISAFFRACDGLKPCRSVPTRHLALPVFFRLLYCCGVRTCEARRLRVEEVDLSHGTISILNSKRGNSRKIHLPQDLLNLFRSYDARASAIYPDRIYFFPSTQSQCYSCGSIGRIFHDVWKEAGLGMGAGNKPRAYDLRHHFALTNLNRWTASGVNIGSKLPYLSRYMGHASLESTDYYLHLVPEFFPTFSEKLRSTEENLPEVNNGQK